MPTPHWIFGDLLGPHFLTPAGEDGPDRGAPVVMIEARSVFRRRRFHRAKAHLVLSAMRHRAAELGVRMTYVRAETYRKGLRRAVGGAPVTVCHPTSYAALRLVRALPRVRVLPARGFLVVREEFAGWAEGRGGRRLLQEDFYRWVRQEHDLLMEGGHPAGGRFNHDHANRKPPPGGARELDVPGPYRPREDDIDAEVRDDLDRWEREDEVRFVGRDGPRRFPADAGVAALGADGASATGGLPGYLGESVVQRGQEPQGHGQLVFVEVCPGPAQGVGEGTEVGTGGGAGVGGVVEVHHPAVRVLTHPSDVPGALQPVDAGGDRPRGEAEQGTQPGGGHRLGRVEDGGQRPYVGGVQVLPGRVLLDDPADLAVHAAQPAKADRSPGKAGRSPVEAPPVEGPAATVCRSPAAGDAPSAAPPLVSVFIWRIVPGYSRVTAGLHPHAVRRPNTLK